MPGFNKLLKAAPSDLVGMFSGFRFGEDVESTERLRRISVEFNIHPTAIMCAIGFNRGLRSAEALLPILGYSSREALINRRDYLFAADIYKHLSIARIQEIYSTIGNDPDITGPLTNVLIARLEHIEENIDDTVSSRIIDNYKLEVRTIYAEGVASIEFAEHRIADVENGFRALTNELMHIATNHVLPPGDLFFRDHVLPAEKRKLIKHGLIPHDMLITRLSDPDIPDKERRVLREFI